MESTAQCDWEGGFLQCPSNEGQSPQWEAIKPLVLNLQATGKTSPCARQRGREGEERGRKGEMEFCPHSGSHASSTQWEHRLTDCYHVHQFLTHVVPSSRGKHLVPCPKYSQKTFVLQQDIKL